MKCPHRFMEFTSDERMQECRPDCACLVEIEVRDNYGDERSVLACGLFARGRPVNTAEATREERR